MKRNERISATKQAMKRNFQAYGLPPYGFHKDGNNLVTDNHEVRIVKVIYNLKFQGWSLSRIARYLNTHDLLKKGKLWQACQVQRILNNSIYVGFLVGGP